MILDKAHQQSLLNWLATTDSTGCLDQATFCSLPLVVTILPVKIGVTVGMLDDDLENGSSIAADRKSHSL